jgi:hypothetical protein
MSRLPARTGWDWVKQGFGLYRKQALGLSVLFFGYMMITFWIGIVPVIGKLLSYALIPFFAVAFMQGCANAEQGRPVHPGLLLIGLRSPAFGALARLGLVYVGVAVIAIGAASLVDGGVLLRVMMRQIAPDSPEAKTSEMGSALLLAALIQLLSFLMLAFTAPLVYWQRMSVGKAVFYSVFSIINATRAFLVFALSWFGISAVLGQVVILILGRSSALMAVLVPVSLVFTIIVFCSFYSAYKQLFGEPEAPDADSGKNLKDL